MSTLIGYCRCSTNKQSPELQEHRIKRLAEHLGATAEIYADVASGKSMKKRPALAQAIERAKQLDTGIVVTNIDRLTRSVADFDSMIADGIKVYALDSPKATYEQLRQKVSEAEQERIKTSQKTKAALQERNERYCKQQYEEGGDAMQYVINRVTLLSKAYRRLSDKDQCNLFNTLWYNWDFAMSVEYTLDELRSISNYGIELAELWHIHSDEKFEQLFHKYRDAIMAVSQKRRDYYNQCQEKIKQAINQLREQ